MGGSAAPSSNSRFFPLAEPREGVPVRCGVALVGTADRGVALVGVVIDAVMGGIDTAGTEGLRWMGCACNDPGGC